MLASLFTADSVFCYRPLNERLYFASLKGLELLETLFFYAATIARNGRCLFSIPFFFFFFLESMSKLAFVEANRSLFHDYTENNFDGVCDSKKKK